MLEKIAVHQELWIKMLVNLGCDINLAKDLVQDMYLRVHRLVKDPERIMYKGDINRYFIWKTLRNLYYSHLKKEMGSIFYRILENDEVVQSEYNMEEDDAFSNIMTQVREIISEWSVYDKRLFELYFIQGLSLRAISYQPICSNIICAINSPLLIVIAEVPLLHNKTLILPV